MVPGFLVEIKTAKGIKSYVVKTLAPEGFGHEYPSDRAGYSFLTLMNSITSSSM